MKKIHFSVSLDIIGNLFFTTSTKWLQRKHFKNSVFHHYLQGWFSQAYNKKMILPRNSKMPLSKVIPKNAKIDMKVLAEEEQTDQAF